MPLSLSASMRRSKPSVSSCSALFASMPCTVAGIPLLPDRLLMRTTSSSSKSSPKEGLWLAKEFMSVGFDIGGKAERVIACTLFRKLGITLFERLDDRHMLGQRHRGAVHPADRQLAVAANMEQDIVGHIDQHRRLAERDQRLVKGDIGLRIFLDVILRQAILAEILEKVAQRGNVLFARRGRDQPRRHALERGPGPDHVDNLALGPANDDDAAAWHGLDEAVLLQHRDRLADRGPADTEALRQGSLVEHDRLGRRID